MKKYTFIDLFAGCGGLTEGFYMQGYKPLAHVEIDKMACKTLKTRMNHYGYSDMEDTVLNMDITSPDVIEKLESVVGKEEVDLIIGGPPCQGFSLAGRRCEDDERNKLYQEYFKTLSIINVE